MKRRRGTQPRRKLGNDRFWRYRAIAMEEAKIWKAHLIHVLGGKCAECGDTGIESPLTIDHVLGRTWKIRDLRLDARVKRYWKEFNEGAYLRVLCYLCNSNGGTGMREFYAARVASDEDVPF